MNLDKIINYILVFILVAVSGFQYFYAYQEWLILGFAFTLLITYIRREDVYLDFKFFYILGLFLFWEILQFTLLGGFSVISIIGTFTRFLLAYLVIIMVSKDFLSYYFNLITVFSAISLFFYALIQIPAVLDFMMVVSKTVFASPFKEGIEEYEHNTNIIIFNYHGYMYSPMRNSGPFWEPGAFSVFICISLTFGLIIGKSLLSVDSVIQIIALITAYSTSGYLVFFIIVLASLIYKSRGLGSGVKLLLKGILLPVAFITAIVIIQSQEFLLPKIQNDILLADETTTSRFGSALADYYKIIENPILGYGRRIENEYGNGSFDLDIMHRNSGATRIIVQWGILAFFYYFLVIRSFKHVLRIYNPEKAWHVFLPFIVLFLSGFSQSIYQYPFFMGLMFLEFIPGQVDDLVEPNLSID